MAKQNNIYCLSLISLFEVLIVEMCIGIIILNTTYCAIQVIKTPHSYVCTSFSLKFR